MHDPYVTEESFGNSVSKNVKFNTLKECLTMSDIIVMGCPHKEFKEKEIKNFLELNKKTNVLFVDGRHAYRSLNLNSNIDYLAV